MPGTSIHMLTEPRRPILTVSPSRSTEVGSPIRIMSGRICALVQPVDDPRRAVGRIAFLVAGDQQRDGAARLLDLARPRRRRRRSRSSCRWRRGRSAGRPRCSRSNGSPAQPSPGGTTSRWPAKPKCGEPSPRIATIFSVGPSGASPSTKRWTVKPSGAERLLEHVEHLAARRRDAGAVDQRAAQARWDRSTSLRPSKAKGGCTMPKIDLDAIEPTNRTGYPPPFDRRSPAAGSGRSPTPAGHHRVRRPPCHAEARRLVEPAPLARQ